MNFVFGSVWGAVAGALAGGFVGCVYGWEEVSRTFTSWKTVWPDCGPQILIPLWMGAVIGLAARVTRSLPSGSVVTAFAGMAAGFFAPQLFYLAFGHGVRLNFGFSFFPIAPEGLLIAAGGAAAIFWYFGASKLLR